MGWDKISAEVVRFAKKARPFCDHLGTPRLNDGHDVPQDAGRYLGIVVAQIALSGSCYPYLGGVCAGCALCHMNMDRLQRLVLIGPEIDPVRAYLIAIQLLDAWTTSLDCISQICRLVHRGRLSCDKNLRHFRPLPLWRTAGSDEP